MNNMLFSRRLFDRGMQDCFQHKEKPKWFQNKGQSCKDFINTFKVIIEFNKGYLTSRDFEEAFNLASRGNICISFKIILIVFKVS